MIQRNQENNKCPKFLAQLTLKIFLKNQTSSIAEDYEGQNEKSNAEHKQ
jgi:hypothetical protein